MSSVELPAQAKDPQLPTSYGNEVGRDSTQHILSSLKLNSTFTIFLGRGKARKMNLMYKLMGELADKTG